jgi:hypothetical protein
MPMMARARGIENYKELSMIRRHVTRAVAVQTARNLVCEASVHGDVSSERAQELVRMIQAPQLRRDRYLGRIAKRAMRVAQLKSEVEGLPDSLDTRGQRLVDVHSLASAWLAGQFEVFDELTQSQTA